MPVCKFYLKGNCKYGDRCYNEHPRHSNSRKSDGNDEYNDGWRGNNNWRNSGHNQKSNQQYRSPMSQSGNQWHADSFSNSGQRYHSKDSRQTQNFSQYQDSNQYGHRNSRNDQYHWSRDKAPSSGNRFDKLSDVNKPEAEAESITQTVTADIKTWAESSMWPFSCYSCTKGHACIEGLPDISPEEMRVIFLLHPQRYQSIWNEIESNYCRRKDELFEMGESTKQSLLAQISNVDNNPSKNLKVSLFYGPEYKFGDNTVTSEASKVAAPSASSAESPATNSAFFKSASIASTTANPSASSVQNKQTPSVFGSTSSTASSNNVSDTAELYTPFSSLTADEKASFESDRYVLGKIPIRPPPTQYCS